MELSTICKKNHQNRTHDSGQIIPQIHKLQKQGNRGDISENPRDKAVFRRKRPVGSFFEK